VTEASGLYDGAVVHHRLSPRRHRLRYRLFQLLIDLDELPVLDRRLRLFGHNRFAVFSLHNRDHLAGDRRPLRGQIEAMLSEAGIDLAGGPIRLLCMPRVLGYVFNPLSVYYCHRRGGELAAVVMEVSNTFGERHCYLIEAGPKGDVVRSGCAKTFFVSPFLGLDMTYDFRLAAPGERVATAIVGRRADHHRGVQRPAAGPRRPQSCRRLLRPSAADPEGGAGDPLGSGEAAGQGRAAARQAVAAAAAGDRGPCGARRDPPRGLISRATAPAASPCDSASARRGRSPR
jgi:DUF1365 family protein